MVGDRVKLINTDSERRVVFFEKMGRGEEDSLRSDGRAFHKRMEEGKNDLAREADLTKSGERLRG